MSSSTNGVKEHLKGVVTTVLSVIPRSARRKAATVIRKRFNKRKIARWLSTADRPIKVQMASGADWKEWVA